MCKATVLGARPQPQQRVLKPATGTARWLTRLAFPNDRMPKGVPGPQEIDTGTGRYAVLPVPDGRGGYHYRMHKFGADLTYDIDTSNAQCWSCDCANYTFGRADATTADLRVCKHIKALQAALKTLRRCAA